MKRTKPSAAFQPVGWTLLAFAGWWIAGAAAIAAMPFSSDLDDFVALFPAYPRVESSTLNMAGGHPVTMRTYRVDEGGTQWLISATDVAGLNLDAGRTLAATRSGVVQTSGGVLLDEHAVRIGRYDGMEIHLRRPDRSMLDARVCVTPRRIYEILVVTPEEGRRVARIERFLQSFVPG